jgi:hypothetical protein
VLVNAVPVLTTVSDVKPSLEDNVGVALVLLQTIPSAVTVEPYVEAVPPPVAVVLKILEIAVVVTVGIVGWRYTFKP